VDAAFTVTRLSEDLSSLIEGGDFEGAEELLSSALGTHPQWTAFIHYQFGRLYHRWNKLSSALSHLNHAVEGSAGNELFMVQVLDELNSVRKEQRGQRP